MYESAVKKRAYRGHKRRITACAECYRRKQRCNHQNPCNICIARGVPERCVYGKPADRISSDEEPSTTISEKKVKEYNDEQEHTDFKLLAQVGYAPATSQEGVAAALTELSEENEQTHPTSSQHVASIYKLRPKQQEKLTKLLSDLPSPKTCLALTRIFFQEANWYFTVLDQYYFDRAYRGWMDSQFSDGTNKIHKDDLRSIPYFPALLFQVLALAAQFVPPDQEAEVLPKSSKGQTLESLSERLSDAGEAVLHLLGRHNTTLVAVQADLMRCAWCKNSGRGAEAWFSLGNAIRQAQDQGLHLEPGVPRRHAGTNVSEELQAEWYNEHKRRIWTCLFTWESHMALQLGRPRMINASDCTVQTPIDTDIPQHPSRTLFMPSSPTEKPSGYTAQLVKYILAQKIHRIMSFGSVPQDYNVVYAIHAEVDQLTSELPAALRLDSSDTSWDLLYSQVVKQRLQIAIIINSFILSLHRPYLAIQPHSLRSATTAALQVLNLSQKLFETTEKHQYKTFTLIFYTIDAGILLSAMAVKFPVETCLQGEAIISAIRDSTARLSILKEKAAAAAAGEKVLIQCLSKVCKAYEKAQRSFRATVQKDEQHRNPKSHAQQTRLQPAHFEESQVASTGQSLVSPTQDVFGFTALSFSDSTSWGDQDIFSETMNNAAYTSQWLEHVNDLFPADGPPLESIDWSVLFQ